MVVDKTTKKLLAEQVDRKIQKDDVLAIYDRQIAAAPAKHQRITELYSTFGAFLDLNSILPYNDKLIEYLNYAIKLAKQEAAVSGNKREAWQFGKVRYECLF